MNFGFRFHCQVGSKFNRFFFVLGIATQTTWRISFQLSTLYENVSSLKSLNIVKTYYVKLFFACKTLQYQPTMAPVIPQNVLTRKLLPIKFDWKTSWVILGYLTSYSVTVFITALDFKTKDIVISVQYLSRSEKCRKYLNWFCWPLCRWVKVLERSRDIEHKTLIGKRLKWAIE